MSDETTELKTEKAAKDVTLYHPAFADVSRVVPADSVDAWTATGWRKTRRSKKG